MKVAFIGDEARIAEVFAKGRREEIESRAEVLPGVVSPNDTRLSDIDALFSTWGMPKLTNEQLDTMPRLKALFYAAGAVDHFSRPLVDRGIQISSAWQANAVPVAEFTIAQILLSCKGYFKNLHEYSTNPERGAACFRGPGAYGETVALLGAGAVGTKVIELLRPFRLDVIVFDAFLTQERADDLQVRKVSLETAFREALVISNHLLDVPDTYGLVNSKLLESMHPNATFINTGRGRTVVSEDLVRVLGRRPDLTALLDVTDPEPLPPDHQLRALPNTLVTSHIAGSIGAEVLRLADCAIEEFERFRQGQPLRYQVFG